MEGETGIPSQCGLFRKLILKASLIKRVHPAFSSALWLEDKTEGACDSTWPPASSNFFSTLVMLDSDIKILYGIFWNEF
ncbi:hypothetical protein [Undibacterium pigrum]|uniref:hypothetical protein n=1 Tax=Undibacterium pigrum TaxID=401470 RepID=UPI0014741CA7|nr:hypothetical protein [Undibacterium pigrum]